MNFDPSRFGPAVAAILGDGRRVMPLVIGSPEERLRPLVARFDPIRDLGTVNHRPMALAVHAGLWLYGDFFDESHAIAQDLKTPEGSAWHAILHRREPDAWNSNYWWRQVGPHPVFREIANRLGVPTWNPQAFTDRCAAAKNDDPELQRIQLVEWQCWFEHCFDSCR